MPYRPNDDGTFTATRMTNRPVRDGACVGPGCGMGAAPSLSVAAQAALGAGARIGDRAARFAVAVVRSRGLGETGMPWKADSQNADGTWVDAGGYSYAEWQAIQTAPEGSQLATGDSFTAASGQDGAPAGYVFDTRGSLVPVSSLTDAQVAQSRSGLRVTPSSPGSAPSGGGINPQDVASFLRSGYGVLQQATGRAPQPRQAPSTGPSTGLILGVLGTAAVVGIGIAVVIAGRRAPRMANRHRRSNTRRGHRKAKYFVQSSRKAA